MNLNVVVTSMDTILEINDNVMLAHFHGSRDGLHLEDIQLLKRICYGSLIQGSTCHWSPHSAIQRFPCGRIVAQTTSELSHGSQKWKQLPHDGSTLSFPVVIRGLQIRLKLLGKQPIFLLLEAFTRNHLFICSSTLGGICSWTYIALI